MPTYNSRVIREAGACVLTVASGGSLNFDSGGALGGTIGGGPTLAERWTYTTGLTQSVGGATCIASSGLKLGQDIAASGTAGIFELADFGNGVKFLLSKSNTTTSANASPGSLLLHISGGGGGAEGSGVRLYIHAGGAGSAGWTKFRMDVASS